MEQEDCLTHFTERVLHQILALVGNAIVFIDSAAAECLHWCNGVEQIFSAGALQIQDMNCIIECLESETKCVFIVASTFNGNVQHFIQQTLEGNDFNHCTAITAVSSHTHDLTLQGSADKRLPIFSQLSQSMKIWMRNDFSTADVRHIPLFISPISSDLFVTPSFHDLMPFLPSDVARLQSFLHSKGDKRVFNHAGEVDLQFLPRKLQIRIKMLAASLNNLFESLNISEDCYGCGHFGNLIATELGNMPSARARRKMATQKSSIVIIDRLLDVVGPLQHKFDSVLDKVLEVMPRLSGHRNDIEIDLVELFASGNVTNETIYPGCLSNSSDRMTRQLLNDFTMKTEKECISILHGHLIAALKNEKLDFTVDSDSTLLEQLHQLTLRFRNNFKLFNKYSSLLQFSTALHSTLKDNEMQHMEEIYSSEKLMLMDLFDNPECCPLTKVFKLLTREHHSKFTVVDAIMLSLFAYSIAGDQCRAFPGEEEKLIEATIKVLLDGNHSEDLLFLVGDADASELQVRLKMADIFERMKCLSNVRSEMKQFRSLLKPNSGHCAYDPMLKRIVEKIFDPARPDLPDVEFRSHGLTDFLKTGFSLFMNVTKPRPDNHNLIFIYVVGGISASEVCDIRKSVRRLRPSTQVIIGSTGLTTPTDVIERVLCQENLFVEIE